ncbi:DUF6257 family protein [Streptomyces albipurpureus]|uniref:DUF6257 family protein n=1 Tax=Streptomyces albipurpureus TaxID=2897419 RepID=A0ABT0V0Z6_9ACTN|nr:DUF6257 family protein [Streptomyces sp. CWNU-1]MCM2393071.1 DUF6257 family protein [Streptomyces sp. CWNU-1]
MNHDEPQLTVAEKARVGWLIARMAKRGIADPDRHGHGTVDLTDLERRVERVIDGARKRQEQTAKKAQ